MIYIENTNDVQTIKVYSAVERGSYTEPDSPVNPEGGLTEYEVQELIDGKLENYYDKQETDSVVSNIDANFQNYYTRPEIDEIVNNIETGEGGGSDGKIFTFRNDGHAYCEYVMEIVDRCIEGKLSTIKFGIDSNVQGTASILNFSKTYKPDFDMIGEEGWRYYLTILYQNIEQTETKTYWYYVGDFSNGMTGTGIWEGTYDYNKLGYIIAPEIKPFGGGDGRTIKINSNYSILPDDLNYAIDTIVNGGNVVFELPNGSKTSFYYEVGKYDSYNEFGDWVSLTRKITIVDTKDYSSFDNAEYYCYNYELDAYGGYTSSSYDEIGNVVINSAAQGKLIEWAGTFVSIDILGTLSLVNVDAVLTNNGTLNQEGQANFSSPVTFNHRVDIEGVLNFNNVNGQLTNKGALDQKGQADFWNVAYFNNNLYALGNIYEGNTKLSDKYATKEDITAINNTLNQIKQQLGIE